MLCGGDASEGTQRICMVPDVGLIARSTPRRGCVDRSPAYGRPRGHLRTRADTTRPKNIYGAIALVAQWHALACAVRGTAVSAAPGVVGWGACALRVSFERALKVRHDVRLAKATLLHRQVVLAARLLFFSAALLLELLSQADQLDDHGVYADYERQPCTKRRRGRSTAVDYSPCRPPPCRPTCLSPPRLMAL